MKSNNLPPGVTDDMIPGNRPEDEDWDRLYDWIADTGISPLTLRGFVVGWCKRYNREALPATPKFHMDKTP